MNRMAIRVKVFDRSEYVEVTSEMLTNPELFLRHGKLLFIKCVLFQMLRSKFSFLSKYWKNSASIQLKQPPHTYLIKTVSRFLLIYLRWLHHNS